MIKKLGEEVPGIGIALSLHAVDNKTRSSIMNVNDLYPLGKTIFLSPSL